MSNLTGAAAFAETAQIASTVHRVHARLASWLRAATAFFDTPLGLDVECARAAAYAGRHWVLRPGRGNLDGVPASLSLP